MPRIIPIRDLKDTAAIYEMCSASKEPNFYYEERIWQNGPYEHGGI